MGTIAMEMHGEVAVLAITNPGRRNAWTTAMRAEFVRIVSDCAANRIPCEALVLTGGSPDAFCAGQDLDEAVNWTAEEMPAQMAQLKRTYDAVRRCPKPVVAAVNAVAAGSGFQIALCADSIVSHPDARMGQPEIRSGMASAVGARLLHMTVGHARMKDVILGGRLLYGHEGHHWGIVNHLVPREAVLGTAIDVARRLAAVPPESFAASKEGIARSFDAEFDLAFADAAIDQSRLQERGVTAALRQG